MLVARVDSPPTSWFVTAPAWVTASLLPFQGESLGELVVRGAQVSVLGFQPEVNSGPEWIFPVASAHTHIARTTSAPPPPVIRSGVSTNAPLARVRGNMRVMTRRVAGRKPGPRAAFRRLSRTVFAVDTVADYWVTMGLVMFCVSGFLGLAYGLEALADVVC